MAHCGVLQNLDSTFLKGSVISTMETHTAVEWTAVPTDVDGQHLIV